MKHFNLLSVVLYAFFTADLLGTSLSIPNPWVDMSPDSPKVLEALNALKGEIRSKHSLLPTDTFHIENAAFNTRLSEKEGQNGTKSRLLGVFRVGFDVFSAQGERVFKRKVFNWTSRTDPACLVYIAKKGESQAAPATYSVYRETGDSEVFCSTEQLLHR